jgi:hypothetical protein
MIWYSSKNKYDYMRIALALGEYSIIDRMALYTESMESYFVIADIRFYSNMHKDGALSPDIILSRKDLLFICNNVIEGRNLRMLMVEKKIGARCEFYTITDSIIGDKSKLSSPKVRFETSADGDADKESYEVFITRKQASLLLESIEKEV